MATAVESRGARVGADCGGDIQGVHDEIDRHLQRHKGSQSCLPDAGPEHVRADRAGAVFKLGISEEIADILDRLTPGQILKMSSSDMLLCNFRFDDTLLLNLLANHERERGVAHVHAAILAAGKAVEVVA